MKSFKTAALSIIGKNERIMVSARDQNLLEGCNSCKIPKVSWNWGVTSIWCSWSWCGLVTLVSRCSNYTGFSLYKAVIPSQTWNCTKSPFRKWSQVSILFYIAKNLETLSSSEVLSTWVFFTGLDQYYVETNWNISPRKYEIKQGRVACLIHTKWISLPKSFFN